MGHKTQFWTLYCISLSPYILPPPLFPHFLPPKDHRSLPALLLEITLLILACRPELWSSFKIKNHSGEKVTFPLIFPLSKVINIGSGNSILESVNRDFSLIFPCRAEWWSSFESNNKMCGEKNFPAFFRFFFENFVISPCLPYKLFSKKTELIKMISCN